MWFKLFFSSKEGILNILWKSRRNIRVLSATKNADKETSSRNEFVELIQTNSCNGEWDILLQYSTGDDIAWVKKRELRSVTEL